MAVAVRAPSLETYLPKTPIDIDTTIEEVVYSYKKDNNDTRPKQFRSVQELVSSTNIPWRRYLIEEKLMEAPIGTRFGFWNRDDFIIKEKTPKYIPTAVKVNSSETNGFSPAPSAQKSMRKKNRRSNYKMANTRRNRRNTRKNRKNRKNNAAVTRKNNMMGGKRRRGGRKAHRKSRKGRKGSRKH